MIEKKLTISVKPNLQINKPPVLDISATDIGSSIEALSLLHSDFGAVLGDMIQAEMLAAHQIMQQDELKLIKP